MAIVAAKTGDKLRHKLTHMSTNTLNRLHQTLGDIDASTAYSSTDVQTVGDLQKLVEEEQRRRRDGGSHSCSGRRPSR